MQGQQPTAKQQSSKSFQRQCLQGPHAGGPVRLGVGFFASPILAGTFRIQKTGQISGERLLRVLPCFPAGGNNGSKISNGCYCCYRASRREVKTGVTLTTVTTLTTLLRLLTLLMCLPAEVKTGVTVTTGTTLRAVKSPKSFLFFCQTPF